MSRSSLFFRLSARFDTDLLDPPVYRPASPDPVLDRLRAWCRLGLAPGGPPVAVARFAVRHCKPDEARVLDALALDLDGSHMLAACPGGLAKLALRLRVKWAEALPWGALPVDHPWDAGHLIDGPDLLDRVGRFVPRRATLILATDVAPARLPAVVDLLSRRAAGFDQPVRLLLVD